MNGSFVGGLAFAFGAVVIWAAQLPIAKELFATVDAFHATAFRYSVPALLLAAALVLREGAGALRLEGRGRSVLGIGFVGMCCSPVLAFGGLMFTRPEIAATILASQPAMAALLDWAWHRRRPSAFTIACVAVAFAGVVTILTHWDPAFAPRGREMVGNLMVVAGALCWVFYTLASAQRGNWSTLRFTTLTMLPGAAGTIVVATTLAAIGVFPVPALQVWLDSAWQVAYLALAGVLIAMMMWNAGARRVGALNATLLLNLIPVITFAIRLAQGHDVPVIDMVGAALVVGALVANNLYLRRLYRAAVPAI